MNIYSIQESAINFANTIYKEINKSVAETMGVDVMWFRAIPDKRNSDVIFQTYTLYGVEDCPLQFKAMYTDSGYDDAALTFNIMGISYAIPMSLEIPLSTWEEVTNNDGTIPQQYDIVYIPISKKLLEVASMTPIKKIGAQLTAYKVNLSTYKPKRNRIIGENLKESIDENTINRDTLFGEDIEKEILDIVDNHQLSLTTSTTKDQYKEISMSSDAGVKDVNSIISYNLTVDGHIISRNYYNTSSTNSYIVKYNVNEIIKNIDNLTFSCWLKINDNNTTKHIKNIKEMSIETSNEKTYIITKTGTKFKKGDSVIIERGLIKIPGVISGKDKIEVNTELIQKLNKNNPKWINVPGFAIISDCVTNIIKSDNFSISIKGNSFVSVTINNTEKIIQLSSTLKINEWYALMIEISPNFTVTLFESSKGLTQKENIQTTNIIFDEININNPFIPNSNIYITNIRLCKGVYNDIDKKIKEFVSYTVKNDSMYIINDDATTFLNKEYKGTQR